MPDAFEVSTCLWAPSNADPFIMLLLVFPEVSQEGAFNPCGDGMTVPLIAAPPALFGRVGFVSVDFRPILVWDFKLLGTDVAAIHSEKNNKF